MSAVSAHHPHSQFTEHDLAEDRSYGRAVLLGSVAGILIWTAVVFLTMRVLVSDIDTGPAVGIAVWVGIWTGLFLGGTITVGLWSGKRH